MWELIQQNRRKSFILFVLMGTCLILLGYFIGNAYQPRGGGFIGIGLAFFIWIILSLISYYSGDSILLAVSGAKEVTPDIHPQLFNVVEEMKIASGLPAMPKIYIIDTPAANAFATGRKPDNCAIAVTAGLLNRLNRDELQGVVAHEMSHISNRDIQFMTFAGVMLGSIVLISQIFVQGMWFSGGGRYRSRDREGGQAQAIFMIVAIVFAILAPIFAQLLYFAISRRREYLADASAARLTRYPEGLASALEKIAKVPDKLETANDATAPLFIINPLAKNRADLNAWTSTHPPIAERIAILRALSQGASLVNYQEAYNKIKGKKEAMIPPSGLKETAPVPLRTASPAGAEKSAGTRKRELGDLIRAVNGFIFLTCACGLKIKLPPNFDKPSVTCPRCGRENKVPSAELATLAAAAAVISKGVPGVTGTTAAATAPATYVRKGTGWESFNCSCGRTIQLSPHFQGNDITCPGCGRKTLIKS